MKKNNKGFFLVEAIVVITLVTSVLAFVYPSLANIYDTFNNQAKYYDQTKDLYTLRALYAANKNDIDNKTIPTGESEDKKGCLAISILTDISITQKLDSDINKLYIVDYVASPTNSDKEFNKYLHNLKKTSWDKDSYRLIGVFGTSESYRYASIKIYNPNPNGFCNDKYN